MRVNRDPGGGGCSVAELLRCLIRRRSAIRVSRKLVLTTATRYRRGLPPSRGPICRRDPIRPGDAASGSVSVQVTLAFPETHGISLAFWQAEQAFFVVEVLTAQDRRIGKDEAPKVPPRVAKVAGEGMSVS